MLVHGGIDGAGNAVGVPEIFNPLTNRWRSLMGAVGGNILNQYDGWFYPRMFVTPNGRLFGMSEAKMFWMTTAGAGTLTAAGDLPPNSRGKISAAVMYQPGKILQLGGYVGGDRNNPSAGAITVDVTGATAIVAPVTGMVAPRMWASATVLPNGEVFVSGGSSQENQNTNSALVAEIWNPATKVFRQVAAAQTFRLYHSASLLLQDGTVLTGGGGAPGPAFQNNVEIYYPPYLYNAQGIEKQRPLITQMPAAARYNQTVAVTYTSQNPIQRATLVRLGAATHSIDSGQQFADLPITVQAGVANVTLPANANIAPPGFYYVFLLDNQGTPSVAKIVALNTDGKGPAINPLPEEARVGQSYYLRARHSQKCAAVAAGSMANGGN
ncbi:MAG: DUF1929 domain-containing protein, partial [Cytophagaceae bacterium]